ncbi:MULTISPECIES: hypothetical protein [Pseudomonas syringae group]|uniref:hypothetical protein n=1 Tax=Pseudomonas syringae group TaxID=136849 RepID=UPI0009FA77E0|nr:MULTISPECIES: hypothetical protein [Pseudomonas syringae group]
MCLPITARQLNALRALQRTDPDLGELATAVALAFDASTIDNPDLARLILEKTCCRIVAGEPGSHWLPVRSRREALRTWASLTAVGRFAESAGIRAFQVEV